MAKFIQFGSGGPAEAERPQPCVQCEAMLADALDGTLSAAEQGQFDLHVAGCVACSQMLADAQRGAAWLDLLKTPRPEPPAALFERILAQTAASDSLSDLTPATSSHQAAAILPFRNRAFVSHGTRLQPRLALTAAMAFFSVGLTLNLTGVRLNELHASDLKPSSMRRNFYQANAHVVRYVDNMRVVYELESRVHDLQQGDDDGLGSSNRAPAEKHSPAPTQQQEHKQPRPRPNSGTSRGSGASRSLHWRYISPDWLSGFAERRAPMNCANHPDRERTAFCQNCGKPLCSECTCTLGSAVFCEPCLAARLSGDTTSSTATGAPYTTPPPPVTGVPNPALAGLLGIIPGVGAMYNGQYAKGIAHLVIFAVLVSLSDANSVFGLFVAGWIFYQVIEAHHTARARRDSTPLPNPFGFNDIGEKLGFGRSWPNPVPSPRTTATSTDAGQSTQPPVSDTPDSPSWTTVPAGSYPYPPPPATTYGAPLVADNPPPSRQSRFPLGATLLIGFGLLFFFRSSGWLPYFHIHSIFPFLLIGIGVWVFVRKMTRSGLNMADDGTAAYKLRLFNALRGSIWIFLIGVLFFLDTFHILSWSHSWPLFIIVAGLMMLFERSTHSLLTPTDDAPAGPIPSPSTPTSSYTEEGR